ncbi:MAG TPA: hypothetical protein VKR55_30770 [Bradyrhizobium sp.]|uniref:hypothetical protein n=1 Tax=Bradyrhizobium sp. TaxID=376 RepID=UPI002D09DA1C|nr:hypothetical protein [Bradyrhizobium sp.]HLZ06515.1 hypothetical protein [Bradyrhizobium sp.]
MNILIRGERFAKLRPSSIVKMSALDVRLHGRGPADIPLEQPTRFDPAVNLKTAKALGIIVPLSIDNAADYPWL